LRLPAFTIITATYPLDSRQTIKMSEQVEAPQFYRIGTAGKEWGEVEKAAWLADAGQVKRAYAEEVLEKLEPLKEQFDVEQYGALSLEATRYPLYSIKTRGWVEGRPTVLITGGVHGYETSGVQGALLFLQTKAVEYSSKFNILVVPCVSPWGYECIQRWNPNAEDPNRGFYPDSSREECAAVMKLVESCGGADRFSVHLDLHETTDTDETEFRPAKAARDGLPHSDGTIPDGFYLVADSENKQEEWHKAMIDAVRKVTHIAPADEANAICGEVITQEGVIAVPANKLFLCSSVTNAAYRTTTEVYPDSPKANNDICNKAQVACITSALDFVSAAATGVPAAATAAAAAPAAAVAVAEDEEDEEEDDQGDDLFRSMLDGDFDDEDDDDDFEMDDAKLAKLAAEEAADTATAEDLAHEAEAEAGAKRPAGGGGGAAAGKKAKTLA